MFIQLFRIQNFKAFEDVTFYFNKDLNILTGVNNSGKTTVLEALSLWHECFTKIIKEAQRGEKNYRRGDYILGSSTNRYFPFQEINSVRNPNFEDIFHQRDKRKKIILSMGFIDEDKKELFVAFKISSSGNNYIIELDGYNKYNYRKFNDYFRYLPEPVSFVYSSPITRILRTEDFVTEPVIKENILSHQSVNTLRNRLYRILAGINPDRTQNFLNDLNYILFNNDKKIEFFIKTNIQNDTKVIILFRIEAKDIEKDIFLLGSGTLQIMEILLDLYNPTISEKDLHVVLLDEPDSHIHRDIQKRLVDTFNKFSSNSQLFITTHNESFIRSTQPFYVFHLEGKSKAEIKSIQYKHNQYLGSHFKGLFPSNLSPIIRSIGSTNGLDFINALEADRLVFVEGEDDAKAFRILLNQQMNNSKKYMFWVLGGISEIYKNILSYKEVFSAIRNDISLWDKSVLVFDKDELSNEHKDILTDLFEKELKIKAYCCNAYTFESTLLVDLLKTAKLLMLFIQNISEKIVSADEIHSRLKTEYDSYGKILESKWCNDKIKKDTYYRYKNSKIEKIETVFGKKHIKIDEFTLAKYVDNYYNTSIFREEYYRLMDKADTEIVIKKVTEQYGVSFSISTDFIELIKLVNKSTWSSEWNFLNGI